MIHRFKEESNKTLPRDLAQIKRAAGGKAGSVSTGGRQIATVLRMSPNVYVTTEKVSHKDKTLIGMDKADIHSIGSAADTFHFLRRFKAYGKA